MTPKEQEELLNGALEQLPCTVELASYNDAVSLKSRLDRFIKNRNMPDSPNPYSNLEILVSRKTVIFRQRNKLQPQTLLGA